MSITVCIPAYKETEIEKTLESLAKCKVGDMEIHVQVLVNGSEADSKEIRTINEQCAESVQTWIGGYSGRLNFSCKKHLNLPQKHAGVGLARRILGDEAASIYQKKDSDGLIVYLDADCTVSENYFLAIRSFFDHHNFQAASIRYEHPVADTRRDLPIIEYESHLRYYILMQNWLGLPYAIHTVGSSMAVRASAYLQKGGMNKRKAGEDFYFLQKFIKDQVCGQMDEAVVYPAARTSDRVPFGTGRAMLSYNHEGFQWSTYTPESFEIIRPFFDSISKFYAEDIRLEGLHPALIDFLESISAKRKIEEIKTNVASFIAFRKRFYQFFDAFQLMKYLHFMRDNAGFTDISVKEAVAWYRQNIGQESSSVNAFQNLEFLRSEELRINAEQL